ncbi:hypothetical protein ACMYYO_13305 [Dermacoccaceae bacterium W4C1]
MTRLAEQTACALARGELVVLPGGGILWAHRERVRRCVGEFLEPTPGPEQQEEAGR